MRYIIEYYDRVLGYRVKYLSGKSFPSEKMANDEINRIKQDDLKHKEIYGLIRKTRFKLLPENGNTK
jgi:hypothetical protein